MTGTVKNLLASFDALSDADKHEATVEILRRSVASAPSAVPDEALVEIAEELFLALDAAEANHAQP